MEYGMSLSSYWIKLEIQNVVFRFRGDVINESLEKLLTPYNTESNLTDNCQVFLNPRQRGYVYFSISAP